MISKRFVRILTVLIIAVISVPIIAYWTIPRSNGLQPRYDVIIVLGNPAKPDGTPGPEQRERVLEGIREFRAGVGSYLIMTGGAAKSSFVEAHIMAEYARQQGVPPAAIIEEGQAADTIQNVYYSAQIMRQHGWRSAEIVSSPSHLPRAALILQAFNRARPELAIVWNTHAAPWPVEYSLPRRLGHYIVEAMDYCLRLRIEGIPNSRFLPTEDHGEIAPPGQEGWPKAGVVVQEAARL